MLPETRYFFSQHYTQKHIYGFLIFLEEEIYLVAYATFFYPAQKHNILYIIFYELKNTISVVTIIALFY